jgi:hypothetical protein
MQICIPKKNDFIVLTDNVISSAGNQKLEFVSKKYPDLHSRMTSFTLKKGEWYQVGSIYTIKSHFYLSLRIQKTRSTRLWMRNRVKNEIQKISLVYTEEDSPILRSRSLECLAEDLTKKCLVFKTASQAIEASKTIKIGLDKKSIRWGQLEF